MQLEEEIIMNNFIMTSGGVIIDEQNKILLKREPTRGWELPGGIVEEGESIKQAVIREIKEETGLEIEIVNFCGVSQEVNKNVCNFWWLGKPLEGELKTSAESLEVGFFSFEEALKMITNKDFKKELIKVMDVEKHPFFITFK